MPRPYQKRVVGQFELAVSLHFAWYNLGPTRPLSKKAGRPTTPAMAAGVENYPWSTFQIAALLD